MKHTGTTRAGAWHSGTGALALVLVWAAGCGMPKSDRELDEPAIDEALEEGALGEPRTGAFVFYDGEAPVELEYRWIEDLMVLEGDIVLDPEDEVSPEPGEQTRALLAVRSTDRLWPRGVVPYRIHSSVTTPGRIRRAMRIWEESTPIRFVPRTDEDAFVVFREKSGNGTCRSHVGYTGGKRVVFLRDTSITSACSLGVVVHEIGHILGFWHEHTRDDRDQYVKIIWKHVADADAFTKKTYGVRKIGRYDINSTMHYRSFTYSSPPSKPSIKRLDGSLILHDWKTLSAKDIAGMQSLYGR